MSEGSNNFAGNDSKQLTDSILEQGQHYNSDSNSNNLVSVRDIYLILRRGLPLIILVSLCVATLTFLYFSLKKDIFEAVATAAVSPSGLDIRNASGISFSPQNTPSFETYKSLAYSDSVVISVLESTKERFPELDIGVQAFKRRSDIEKIYGPLNNRPDTADRVTLAISQKFRDENPELSVVLTNTWTEKTIETVQDTLSTSLDSIDALTKTAFEDARATLGETQEALKQASSKAAIDVLDAQVLVAGRNIAEQKVRLSEAKTELAVAIELQNAFLNQAASTLSDGSRQLLEVKLQKAKTDLEQAFSDLQAFEEEHDLIALEARNIFLSIQLAEFEQLLSVAKASGTGVLRTNSAVALNAEMLQNAFLDSASALKNQADGSLKIENEILPIDETSPLPQSNRIVNEVTLSDGEIASARLSELRNYIGFQALIPDLVYTEDLLEKTINTLSLDLSVISSKYGILKVEKAKLQSAYELTERTLNEVLTERSQLTNENEALLIALEAEVAGLEKQIEFDEQDLVVLQAQRAEAQQVIGTLLVEVEAASEVYAEIGGLEPTISYLTQLAPLSAQVINLASQSLEPIGTGRSLPTALAFLLTAIIMTVLVFFREAIKA